MSRSGLHDIGQHQLLLLWGELVEAAHGVHKFGGDTAELYAYRFGHESPAANAGIAQERREQAIARAESLFDLLTRFASVYVRRVEVDGQKLGRWLMSRPFEHRVHVKVGPPSKHKAPRVQP